MNTSQSPIRISVRDRRLPSQFGQSSWQDLENYQRVMEFLKPVNELTGPFTGFNAAGMPVFDLPTASAYISNVDLVYMLKGLEEIMQNFSVPAAGKGLNLPWAYMSCLGESVERMLGFWSNLQLRDQGRIIPARYVDLVKKGENAVHPDKVNHYHPKQYADPHFVYRPLKEDDLCGWIKGKSLLTGEDTWAPAQMASFGYVNYPGEPFFGFTSSAGLASGPFYEDAVAHGMLEAIERDAMNVRWITKSPPTRITGFDLEELLPQMQDAPLLHNPNIEVNAYAHSIDTPGIHVVTLQLVNRALDSYCWYPGGGSTMNIQDSFASAVGEVVQATRFMGLYALMRSWRILPAFLQIDRKSPHEEIDNLFKTTLYYGYQENCQRLHREYFDRAPEKSFEELYGSDHKKRLSLNQQIDHIRQTCRDMRIDPVIVDLTPREFKHIKLVKCFAPELAPYYNVNVLGNYGHPRYAQGAVKAGLIKRPLAFEEMQHMPFPYP